MSGFSPLTFGSEMWRKHWDSGLSEPSRQKFNQNLNIPFPADHVAADTVGKLLVILVN